MVVWVFAVCQWVRGWVCVDKWVGEGGGGGGCGVGAERARGVG